MNAERESSHPLVVITDYIGNTAELERTLLADERRSRPQWHTLPRSRRL